MSWAGITGKSANTDRAEQLGSYTNLNNLFNFGMNSGSNLTSSGSSATGAAQGYYQNILSGNRSQVDQAVAPAVNSTLSAADASRRTQANMGTARGGGATSTNAGAGSKTMADITNQIFGARTNAASGEASVGGTELGAGSGLLSTAGGAMDSTLQDSTQSREWTINNNKQNIGLIANVLSGGLTAAFGF